MWKIFKEKINNGDNIDSRGGEKGEDMFGDWCNSVCYVLGVFFLCLIIFCKEFEGVLLFFLVILVILKD